MTRYPMTFAHKECSPLHARHLAHRSLVSCKHANTYWMHTPWPRALTCNDGLDGWAAICGNGSGSGLRHGLTIAGCECGGHGLSHSCGVAATICTQHAQLNAGCQALLMALPFQRGSVLHID